MSLFGIFSFFGLQIYRVWVRVRGRVWVKVRVRVRVKVRVRVRVRVKA